MKHKKSIEQMTYEEMTYEEKMELRERILSKYRSRLKKDIGMNLIEATNQAVKKGCCIKRKSWEFETAVLPTDICYELLTEETAKKERRPFWNPQTDDILADDWILVD